MRERPAIPTAPAATIAVPGLSTLASRRASLADTVARSRNHCRQPRGARLHAPP